MYIPPYFAVTDQDELVTFMQRHPFALLITTEDGIPTVTHLPLEVEVRGEEVYLTGHLARSNPQGEALEKEPDSVLAVFQGPHAYISSSWYAKPSVPTWNYMTVHAYGKARLISSPEEIEYRMRDLLAKYEQSQEQPVTWEAVPAQMMSGLLAGILCFEIKLERVEGKYKLSQNRSSEDRAAIIAKLEAGGEQEQSVAAAMRILEESRANQVFTKTSR